MDPPGSHAQPLAPKPTARIPELDGIRGVAILLVLLYHYLYVDSLPTDGSMSAVFVKSIALTWSGVDLFFVLSGFLIASILLDNRNTRNYFSVFYARRAFRILPLYGVVLCAFFVLRAMVHDEGNKGWVWLLGDPLPSWTYVALVQNFAMAVTDSFGPAFLVVTWSLAVEEQFYLLLPALARAMTARRLAVLSMTLIPIAPLLRTILVLWSPERGTVDSYALLFCRWDALFMGVLAAIAIRSPGVHARLTASNGRAVVLATLGSALAVTGLILLHQGWRTPVMRSLGHTVMAFFYVCVLLCAVLGVGRIGWFLRLKPLIFMGTISYGLYLLHHPVRGILFATVLQNEPHVANATTLILTITSAVATMLLAYASWRYFESPLLKIGQRWKYSAEPTASRLGAPSLGAMGAQPRVL